MKLLVTAKWAERYVDALQSEFPQVEFVNGETPQDFLAAADGVRSQEANVCFTRTQQLFLPNIKR
jgi:hypothetical protein